MPQEEEEGLMKNEVKSFARFLFAHFIFAYYTIKCYRKLIT